MIPAVLHHIDVLVLATRYEELPSVLVEGMAAGLPVIATRVGGIPDLIQDDVNGLLVSPGDVTELAAAITRLLAEPATAVKAVGGGGAALPGRIPGRIWPAGLRRSTTRWPPRPRSGPPDPIGLT